MEPGALREAVINGIIHNNYSTELVPKFEIFNDRLEITSAVAIHPGKEQEDFFSGYSMPRNKPLMRVFKDLGMVEYLGSGMPRILKAYPREAFTFASQFIRLSMPHAEPIISEVGPESIQNRVLQALSEQPLSKSELAKSIGQKSISGKLNVRVRALLEQRMIEYTLPDKPNSRLQQYRLTEKGRMLLQKPGRGSK